MDSSRDRTDYGPNATAIVPLGELPKTSSGKAQRRKTKQLYEAGELPQHDAE